MKKTKTWKIGEYCKGGIITVEIKKNAKANTLEVAIIGKDWDHSAGDRRSSDQSKAKEFDRETQILSLEPFGSFWNQYNQMERFLNDLTTAYYADQVLTWIKDEVKKHSAK